MTLLTNMKDSAKMTDIGQPVSAKNVSNWDGSADLIVVGMGVAGVCAALEAHRAGLDVLVIERASGGGGASATSEGIFYLGGGTALQRDCGYDDTPEEMFKFIRASTSTPDDESIRRFCDHSVAHFDWLEAQGVPFERRSFKGKAVSLRTGEGLLTTGNEKSWPFCEQAVPAPRGHQTKASPEQGGGAAAMLALLAAFEREGIAAIYDSTVTALVVDDDGRVVGVRVRQGGKDLHFRGAAGTILAAGSFNLNADMTRENLPVVSRHGIPLGIPSNDGAGILLGQSVGGVTLGMDGVIATASIYPPAQLIKGIIVNSLGQRFIAEDVYHGRLANHIEQQPDQKAYLIVDSEIFAYPEVAHTLIDGWETVAEMEAGIGLPQGSLQATMDDYNRDMAQGEDHQFHKQAEWLKPLNAAPYAAFNISFDSSSYHYIALGGLRTNADGQVMGADAQPIAGLYAAGACAAHMPQAGREYASGLSLGPGSFFARMAARHAAAVKTGARAVDGCLTPLLCSSAPARRGDAQA
jgi:3-oxo-5alpha-steroid 4-dehydrogenase